MYVSQFNYLRTFKFMKFMYSKYIHYHIIHNYYMNKKCVIKTNCTIHKYKLQNNKYVEEI